MKRVADLRYPWSRSPVRIPGMGELILDDVHDVVGRRLGEPGVADLIAGCEPQLRGQPDGGSEAALGLVEPEVVPLVGGSPPLLVVPPGSEKNAS